MSVEQQLLNEDNADVKRSQSQVVRSTSDIQTFFQALCDQKSDDSPDIVNVIKNVCVYLSLVFKVAMEVTKPLVQVPNIEKKSLLSSRTNPAAPLESNKPVSKPVEQGKGGKNKRSKLTFFVLDLIESTDNFSLGLQLLLSSSTAEQEEPKENDQPIPVDSTEFTYDGKIIPIHVDQLNGVQLSHGNFGSVSSVIVKSTPDIRIAVKVRHRHLQFSQISHFDALF